MTITRPTATCYSIDELKEYLSGWSDDAGAGAIETHLLVCSDCDRALRELESKPDTLLQSLQGTEVAGSRSETDRATEAAIEKAKQLMDLPVENTEDRNRATWQPANRELGVYELLKPLGRGGMGAVYLANHRQLKKHVAIKLLPIMSAEDSDVRARFQREIRVVGRLNHPSIVAATDAGEIDGTQFLVMEYVSGLDLSRLARLLGKLPVADACELIRQVALGLSCAHAEGVVHRDVKPSNLMLDETGHIRIMDFGLAQLSFWDEASVDLTTVGQLMGTLDYMAPEQAEFGGNVDYRADLYALGATLFRLLCGRPPLAAAPNQSPLEKLRLLANHQPPKLDTLCPEAPAELVTLAGTLLSRSPQDRPASAAHVAEQLAEFTESADLVGLLKRAQDKAAESPELLKPEKLAILEKPGFYPHLAEASKPPNSRRIVRWLIAAALPLLIIAGIFIKLETDKGQLVIESDIDNIKVQIASDGKPVSGLTINHGITATRLRADKYEVTIDGPSDGLTIENEQFTIKNGETVVARIKYVTTMDSSQQPTSTATTPAASTSTAEPLYEGNTLSEWLDMLERDLSPGALADSLRACDTFLADRNLTDVMKQRIGTQVLQALPRAKGNAIVANTQFGGNAAVDMIGFDIMARAFTNSFYTQWIREYESANDQWRTRLLVLLRRGGLDAITRELRKSDIDVLLQWAKRELHQPLEPAENAKHFFPLADTLVRIPWQQEQQLELIEAIKHSPHIDARWWLSRPVAILEPSLVETYTVPDVWAESMHVEVLIQAIHVISDSKSPDDLVAQAAMILSNTPSLAEQQKTEILAAVNRRLIEIANSPEQLVRIVPVNSSFASLVVRSNSSIVQRGSVNWEGDLEIMGGYISWRLDENLGASVTQELLDLYQRLKSQAIPQEGLEAVTRSLADAKLPNLRDWAYGVTWPELQVYENHEVSIGFGGAKKGNNNEASDVRLEAMLPNEILKVVLHEHPALVEYRNSLKTDVTDEGAKVPVP